MRFLDHSVFRFPFPIVATVSTAFLVACSPSAPKPKGPAGVYQEAKQMFRQGNLDRTIKLTDQLTDGSTSGPYALEARVLEVVIYSGRVRASKELADAYQKGSRNAKNPRYVAVFNRRRSDALQSGGTAALNLGQVALDLTSSGGFPRELTLDAPWPSAEGPAVIAPLERISQGGWVAEPDQDAAAVDVQRKGIDDALAGLVGGGRAKARTAMMAGPLKLQGLDFALFLGNEVERGATLLDWQYLANSDRLKSLSDVAERVADSVEAMLKQSPNKEKEEELKKLRKAIKTRRRRNI